MLLYMQQKQQDILKFYTLAAKFNKLYIQVLFDHDSSNTGEFKIQLLIRL